MAISRKRVDNWLNRKRKPELKQKRKTASIIIGGLKFIRVCGVEAKGPMQPPIHTIRDRLLQGVDKDYNVIFLFPFSPHKCVKNAKSKRLTLKQKNNTEKNRQNAWGFFFNSKWPKISYETEYIVQCAKCLSLLRITQSGKTCLYSRERALPSTAGAGQAFVPTGAGFDPPKNRPLQCCANRIVLLKLRPALFPLLLVTPTFELALCYTKS